MLRENDFFKHDNGCPLLMQNHKYLPNNDEHAWNNTRNWIVLLLKKKKSTKTLKIEKKLYMNELKNNGQQTAINNYGLQTIKKPERIIVRDAERNFLSQKKREIFITVLTIIKDCLSDYQQTLSYVTGILLLFYDIPTTIEMIVTLAKHPKYGMSGYWKHEATLQAIDAYILFKLLETYNNELYKHLKSTNIMPESFIPKWFGGLCVQIMPIKYLILFFNNFFKYGLIYLFGFGISMFNSLKPHLIKTNKFNELYAILALDRNTKFYLNSNNNNNTNESNINGKMKSLNISDNIDKFFNSLLNDSLIYYNKILSSNIDIHNERSKAFELNLFNRYLNAAINVHYIGRKLSEINDDDEIDCQFCDDGYGELYCNVCQKYICEVCHKNAIDDHETTHDIKIISND